MIVLNELDWASGMIRSGTLEKPVPQALTAIAKYYFHEGYSKHEVREKLERDLIRSDPAASAVDWADTLDRVTKYAQKHRPIMLDSVRITKPELDTIAKLGSVQQKRLAFTLLCLAKFRYAVNPETNYWVSTPDTDIMKMANIKTSVRRQSQLFADLREAGLIRFSRKVDSLSVQVLFCSEGEVEMEITDFRSLGYQYLYHYDRSRFYTCQNCGLVVRIDAGKQNGRPKKYCEDCAYRVHIQQSVGKVMKRSLREAEVGGAAKIT